MSEEKKKKEAVNKIVGDITNIFKNWLTESGTSSYVGQILLTILLSEHPLTQKEIADRLNVSQSTISRNISLISESPPLIYRTKVPNTKEWQYEKRGDAPLAILLSLLTTFQGSLKKNVFAMERALAQTESESIRSFPEAIKINEFLRNLISASDQMADALSPIIEDFQKQFFSDRV
ncbi:MAG: HTH domain-containing protein [Candidatus Hodarchaeales archaeon]|jgi:DNA-binding transcriptional regulator GbsR (MarR family)